jgi:hypothetical protein
MRKGRVTVVAADGTIYVNSGFNLYAFTSTGTQRWVKWL